MKIGGAFTPVSVVAASAITAAGANAAQTCASIRAGIIPAREHAYYTLLARDEWEEEEPLTSLSVPTVDPFIDGAERLIRLALPALGEVIEAGKLTRGDLAGTPLLLSLPAPDAATDGWGLNDGFSMELSRRSGVRFGKTTIDRSGRPSMLGMLSEASRLIASGEAKQAVILGVDSYLSEDRLELLDQARRLKSPRSPDGFCPGEGASALLVRSARQGGTLTVTRLGSGDEPETRTSEKPSSGVGLTQALRALGPLPPWVLCDLNGESGRSFEWGIALARVGAGITRLVHPAITVGEIGSAIGGVLVNCTIAALARGYAPDRKAALFCASDEKLRVAALLESGGS